MQRQSKYARKIKTKVKKKTNKNGKRYEVDIVILLYYDLVLRSLFVQNMLFYVLNILTNKCWLFY